MLTETFDQLTPDICLDAIEEAYGVPLNGLLSPYPSYVNRVYGVGQDDGPELIAKFYRPGRWSRAAIDEEHRFLRDCHDAEIPVAAPLENAGGETVTAIDIEPDPERGPSTEPGQPSNEHAGHGSAQPEAASAAAPPEEPQHGAQTFYCALFPKMGGRNFDPESDDDWTRLGTLIGRLHHAAAQRECRRRPICLPDHVTRSYLEELLADEVVHPDCAAEFEEIARGTLDRIAPRFSGIELQRVHGDLHRGNILDRMEEGLMLIDFDDMMLGPPVQDLWLLLPDYRWNAGRELTMLLDGYEQFRPFEQATLELIESLRFMRMIYFLTWRSRQRHDYWFRQALPDWGTKQFWVKELEDLRLQSQVID
jgi:Ser/Thr protein kinase RdoA (MazF antagonist)